MTSSTEPRSLEGTSYGEECLKNIIMQEVPYTMWRPYWTVKIYEYNNPPFNTCCCSYFPTSFFTSFEYSRSELCFWHGRESERVLWIMNYGQYKHTVRDIAGFQKVYMTLDDMHCNCPRSDGWLLGENKMCPAHGDRGTDQLYYVWRN
jgi:hypothetical protein